LTELRYVTREVGYSEAKKMPREIRHWWIDKMNKDNDPKGENQGPEPRSRIVTRDV
jgi:hypothetical protein